MEKRIKSKRKNGLVKVWLVMINYWDLERLGMLGIVKELRIIGNRNRYTWDKFVILQKQ